MPTSKRAVDAEATGRELLTRRNLLAGAGATLAVSTLASRPGDFSGPIMPYFSKLSNTLKAAGVATPRLIVDRARLRQNTDLLMAGLPQGLGYRIVAKSLPGFGLLDEVASRSGSNRMMVFNLEFLQNLSSRRRYYDLLLGKPLPVKAAASFYQSWTGPLTKSVEDIQWLVDTPERIYQYADLAETFDITLRLNLEIDVGLHRGGFSGNESVARAIRIIQDNNRLQFTGFMGYEPHLASLPASFGIRERATRKTWDIYSQALRVAEEVTQKPLDDSSFTRNAGGSPTYRLYRDTKIASEVSVGSALVKPTHFDTDLLEDFIPASFIAAPVIKSSKGLEIPHIGFLNSLIEAWNPNKRQTFFIYGGNWQADPVSPEGLNFNGLFGRSSNQEMLNGSSKIELSPDDYVFFRPHQSEALFLQFGDIAVYENGALVDEWPVFPAAA